MDMAHKENEDTEPIYQSQKSCTRKAVLKNHGAELIESILSCYVRRYSDVYSERNEKDSVIDGDNILFMFGVF